MPPSTVASVSSDDVHVTSLFVASNGNTVAVSVISSPIKPAASPLIKTDSTSITTADISMSCVASMPSAVAVIVTVPTSSNVTMPPLTVASVSSDDVHVTSLFVASNGNTVAVSVISSPIKPAASPLIKTDSTSITTAEISI